MSDTKGRVLVVDDHEAQRELLSIELEDHGFDVIDAASGRECLEIIERDPTIDVILLDIEMPGMSGVEVCRKLKSEPDTADIPILFVTGWRDDDPMIVEALSAGGNDFVSKDTATPVLAARLVTQVSIRRSQRRIEEMAMRDALTGLFSRRFFFDAVRRAIKSETRSERPGLGCLMVDIDHFKRLNDTKGHLAGDEALKAVASLLQSGVRETDIIARFGGEEFVALLPHTGREGAEQVGEKLRASVERDTECTVSVGVAWQERVTPEGLGSAPQIDELVQRLIARADQSLYRAKETGRNRVCVWEGDDDDKGETS
jgi:diguanylate cyclase (GGDEF)-like protein